MSCARAQSKISCILSDSEILLNSMQKNSAHAHTTFTHQGPGYEARAVPASCQETSTVHVRLGQQETGGNNDEEMCIAKLEPLHSSYQWGMKLWPLQVNSYYRALTVIQLQHIDKVTFAGVPLNTDSTSISEGQGEGGGGGGKLPLNFTSCLHVTAGAAPHAFPEEV